MPFRILIYCDDHGTGGAAQATHRLALGLLERGYDVVYAQTPTETPWLAERKARGIRHAALPYDTIKHFTAVMEETRAPARVFSEHEPDLVIFADSLMESTLGAKTAARFLGIPYLIVKHLVVADALYTRKPDLKARVHEALLGSRGMITVSEQNHRLLLQQFPRDAGLLSVIHNSVPDRYFEPASPERRAAFRREHAIPDNRLAVLTVAALNQRKGLHYQAHLLKLMKAAGILDRFVFVWAGEPDPEFFPPLWADLEAAGCTGAVRAIGFQSDVGRCLEGCDAFLLPSQQEGLPLVVLEAMGKAVPIIATAVGGTPEAMGDTGVLAHDPNADPNRMLEEIARHLQHWSLDRGEARRIGEAGRRRAQDFFRADSMLDRYEAAVRRAAFAPGDYVSPGLHLIKPDWRLPFLKPAEETPETGARLCDARFPRLPPHALDRDEAHILYNLALSLAGRHALEVGCSMGWTLLHLLAAGLLVDVVDPLLVHPDIRRAFASCLPESDTAHIRFIASRSEEMVPAIAESTGTRWSLVFLDSQREVGSAPPDRVAWERVTTPDAAVLVHGLARPEAAETLRRLKGLGWNTRVYRTRSLLGMAWRGNVTPVEHVPDPALPAGLPTHLTDLAGTG